MKCILIGSKGMLATDFASIATEQGLELATFDLPDFDLTNPDHIANLPDADWIVNCAAYTQVDAAEENQKIATAVNAMGPALLAEHARKKNTPVFHISTDYVFDGELKDRAYKEDDPTNPINVYGRTKREGEEAILQADCPAIIVRTQSLFGHNGPNFIKAICNFIKQGKTPLRVVSDQTSCPTWSMHLAEAMLHLMREDFRGIVHTSSSGSCSWHEFACAIARHTAPETEVIAVPASTYPRPAKRPANSVLDKTLYQDITGQLFPHWQEALEGYFAQTPSC